MNWIDDVSSEVEKFLGRSLKIQSYAEYLEVGYGQTEWWLSGVPVSSFTSLKEDASGEFDGSETTLTSGSDYYLGPQSDSVVLVSARDWVNPRGLLATYTGGLAYSGTRTTMTVDAVGSIAAGNFIVGGTSDAQGIVRSASGTTLVVETIRGTFDTSGETLTEYSDEAETTATGETATMSAITQQSLAELYPSIVRACEMEVLWRWKNKHSMNAMTMSRDNVTLRNDTGAFDRGTTLQPETIGALFAYRSRMLTTR